MSLKTGNNNKVTQYKKKNQKTKMELKWFKKIENQRDGWFKKNMYKNLTNKRKLNCTFDSWLDFVHSTKHIQKKTNQNQTTEKETEMCGKKIDLIRMKKIKEELMRQQQQH